jgi:hypothetical protein
LTIEGGIGTTYKKFLTGGLAYYAQWKVTDDTGLAVPSIVQDQLGKNHAYGLGPDISVALPLTKDLTKVMILNFRYEFETGVRLDTKGGIVAFSAAFKLL